MNTLTTTVLAPIASGPMEGSRPMDNDLPFKVIKVPLALGVCIGLQGEVLHETESEAAAKALMYETWLEDKEQGKGIYYTYDVVEWRPH